MSVNSVWFGVSGDWEAVAVSTIDFCLAKKCVWAGVFPVYVLHASVAFLSIVAGWLQDGSELL